MKKFIASVFEFHTGYQNGPTIELSTHKWPPIEVRDAPRNGLASIWLTATDNDLRRTDIPIELEGEFQQIGPFPYEMADQISGVLKSLFKEIDIEYVELATSDD